MGLFFGTKPKVTIDTKTTQTPEQQALATLFSNLYTNKASTPFSFGDIEKFQPSAAQNMSLETLSKLSDQVALSNSGFDQASQNIQNAPTATDLFGNKKIRTESGSGKYLQDVFGESPTDFQDFFNTSVRDPSLRDFQETVLPGISRRQGLEGFTTSGRVQQDQFAQRELLDSLTRSRSDLAFRTGESAAGRRLAAAQSLAGVESGNLDRTLQAVLADAGIRADLATTDASQATNRALGLADIESTRLGSLADVLGVTSTAANEAAGFNERQIERDIRLKLAEAGMDQAEIDQLLTFLQTQQIENIVKNKPGSSGLLGSLIQAGGQVGAAAVGGSDKRLKDIGQMVFETPDGIKFYTFQWNSKAKELFGLEGWSLGVIAQELQKIKPGFVLVGSDGYLRVRYGELFNDMIGWRF